MKYFLSLCIAMQFQLSYSQTDSVRQWFPLQKGNVWKYTNYDPFSGKTNFSYTQKVLGDTLLSNGKKYFKLKVTYYDVLTFSITRYIRFDSATSNIYEWQENEFGLDSLSCSPGDTLHKNIVCDSITSNSVLGMVTKVKSLHKIGYFNYKLAFGLGKYFESNGSYIEKLIYAEINNNIWGKPDVSAIIDSLARYHPLQKGNLWQYKKITTPGPNGKKDTTYFSTKIIGDTIIANKRWSIFESKDFKTGATGIYLQRFDSTNGNVLTNPLSSEYVLDSTYCNTPNILFSQNKLRVLNVNETNVFGNTTTLRRISNAGVIDVYYTWDYVWGIGKTGYTYFHNTGGWEENSSLVYAEINGKKYGTPLTFISTHSSSTPITFALSHNYPNPFNPTTIIPFSIPYSHSNEQVRLLIYNVQGQLIKELLNKQLSSGNYSMRWDGTTTQGITAASGIYFYHLIVGTQRLIGKMNLLK